MSSIRIALFAAVVTAAFAVAAPAQAQAIVTQISSDPFAPNSLPTAAHATEVEPDTFAFGSTVVAAFPRPRRPGRSSRSATRQSPSTPATGCG